MKEHSDNKSEAGERHWGSIMVLKTKEACTKKAAVHGKWVPQGSRILYWQRRSRAIHQVYGETWSVCKHPVQTLIRCKEMFYAGESGKTKHTWTSGEPHSTWENLMGVPYGWAFKNTERILKGNWCNLFAVSITFVTLTRRLKWNDIQILPY